MFVKNKERIDFKYRKGTYLAVLKAMTVSYVDETKVTAKDLLDCYGQRIDIISRDLAAELAPLVTRDEKKAVKKAETKKAEPKKVETVKKDDLNDSFIEKILGEIEDENKGNEVKDLGLDELDGIKLPEGNEDVEDFLNGKTDDLPEGTQIISEAEALKLQAEAEAKTKKETKTTKTKAKTTTSKPRAKRGSKSKKA